ncbi:MAG TPA: DapH/DapD/GlmU-related protein [Solirubrobacterales bacterium]|nr:DapH/DapD/GlmU-related protein [Solirubrobacterales bacterium]
MDPAIAELREWSLLRTAWARLRQRDAKVVPFKRTSLGLAGTFDGGGRLLVGKQWRGRRPLSTELVVARSGRCTVTGEFVVYSGGTIEVGPGATLELASGYLNNRASILCFAGVKIGRDAAIGPEVDIRDSDSHLISGATGPSTRPIEIGDHVWIGARAMILKGVRIGDGAIVAAGAVVARDVAPGTLVAGVPARFVREATWGHEPD